MFSKPSNAPERHRGFAAGHFASEDLSMTPIRSGFRSGLVALVLAVPASAQVAGESKAPVAAARPLSAAQKRVALQNPASAFWKTKAGDTVVADIETSRGTITVELIRAWAPAGVDRFYNLARAGYFDDSRFFRVVFGFIAQFGIAGNGTVASLWATKHIAADSVRASNVRGTLSFAQFKPTDRTTNVFINLRDNLSLDTLGFAPIGRIVQGLETADSLYAGYGEIPASDKPLGNPQRLYGESNRYLDAEFPKLDRLLKITIRPSAPPR
jgi:peptidyl-prolyl cis-trans isomerase A (cyclophilin A)